MPEPKESYDIVVVGGGGSGLTAAAYAKMGGADSVLVVERISWTGGSTSIFCGSTKSWLQRLDRSREIPLTPLWTPTCPSPTTSGQTWPTRQCGEIGAKREEACFLLTAMRESFTASGLLLTLKSAKPKRGPTPKSRSL
ncbi:MAG: FAD-binding protein [Hungatella sp.]|nr:FAD-binding protein [Hungatella sp.]